MHILNPRIACVDFIGAIQLWKDVQIVGGGFRPGGTLNFDKDRLPKTIREVQPLRTDPAGKAEQPQVTRKQSPVTEYVDTAIPVLHEINDRIRRVVHCCRYLRVAQRRIKKQLRALAGSVGVQIRLVVRIYL